MEGTITRLTKFGAFARLTDDVEGLIHISEISEKRIEHPKEVLTEGESVTLRIIKIDTGNHRIGLSLRRVDSMAYADMDWQSLADEALGVDSETKPAEEPAKKPAKAKKEKVEEPKAEVEAEEPKAEIEEPKTEVEEPKVEVEEPKAKAKKPKAEVEEPKTETEEPKADSEEPKAE